MRRKSRLRHLTPVLTAGLAGLVLSAAVWKMSVDAETRANTAEFIARANNVSATLQRGIEEYWDKLRAVKALIDASDDQVTRAQFETFGNAVVETNPGILNFSWLPRVTRKERAGHERAAQFDSVINYEIRQMAPDRSLIRAPDEDEYFPKFYSTEPRTSSVYGLDIRDSGPWQQTLERARDNGGISISPPLELLIGDGNRLGFWAVVPVYAPRASTDTLDARRTNLTGFVQGVFQIGAMIDAKLEGITVPLRLYLFSPGANKSDPSIYVKSVNGVTPQDLKSQDELRSGFYATLPLSFGDVPWTMIIKPEAGSIRAIQPFSTIILVAGIALTLALMLFLWAISRANRRIEEQNMRFDAALNNMAQGLLMFDGDGSLIASNRRIAELSGLPWEVWQSEVLGKTMLDITRILSDQTGFTERDPEKLILEYRAIVSSGTTGTLEFERTDGHTYSATCAPMADGRTVVTIDDVTARRRTDERISHLAHYDTLTDLPNRSLFYERMDQLLKGVRKDRTFAVLSLDLDDFKHINDTLGHPVGDRLLQLAAARMRGCIRTTDMVARLGGDEFTIVQVTVEQPGDAVALAKRLIDELSAPYEIDDHQISIGASIGIAIAPNDGTDPDRLVKNSDLALYKAKADGGNRYQFFMPDLDIQRAEYRRLHLALVNALAKQEFALHYQPIVNLHSGLITTCEALIRWNHPERGNVPPLDFIPVAEQTGLIVPIGEWVLNQACAEAMRWPNDISVAVNVSPAQFKNADFFCVVADALKASGLPAHRLELEITELVLLRDDNASFELLKRLKALGIMIAMDDFGAGYSSLGYLRRFSFGRVKIDRSFIQGVVGDSESRAIIRAVVGLGRSMGFITTAEGVETEEQRAVLRMEGVTQAQGYLLGRPIPAADIRTELAASKRSAIRMA